MNCLWQKFFWTKRSQQECPRWVLHSILRLCQFYFSAWVIRKKYVEFVWHTNPCIHNSENICSVELSLFSCLLTFVYQLIVKSMRAFVHRCLLLLWSVKPFYSGMTRRNKTPVPHPYSGLGQSSCVLQLKYQSSFCSVLPKVLPTLCQECHENCTFSYELLT